MCLSLFILTSTSTLQLQKNLMNDPTVPAANDLTLVPLANLSVTTIGTWFHNIILQRQRRISCITIQRWWRIRLVVVVASG